MKRLIRLSITCLLTVGLLFSASSCAGGSSPASPSGATVSGPAVYNSDRDYFADINIAGYGTITVRLLTEVAPETVKNFVSLSEDGFYDGLTFHRIMQGFMMQGGDPNGNGTGGSGKKIKGEFSQNGYSNPLSHVRGVISMARGNNFDSASSQFFIMHADNTTLDGRYAAFGYVTSGLDVVDTVCNTAMPIDNNGTIPSAQQPVITSVTVRSVN